MNRLVYGNYIFTDDDIVFGGSLVNNLSEYLDLISSGLKPNICTLCLKVPAGFDPDASHFGDEVTYYIDDGATLRGKFYVKSKRLVLKNESEIYRYEFTSGIGLLAYVGHDGGMYEDTDSVTAGAVIADIMGGIPYTIDTDLAQTKIVGWLPRVKAARDNLRDVLFQAGGSVKMSQDGSIRFGFLGTSTAKVISDYNMGVGGGYDYPEAATRVDVTAHEYHNLTSDERITLYDNSQSGVAVQNWLVEFNEPCHDLEWNGSPISSSWDYGANYAIITGIGTLTGQKYTHTTSVFSVATGAQNVEDVVQPINTNYLIGPHNVANVARRAAAYYGTEKVAVHTIRITNERPGDQVTFKDKFGVTKTGFIEQMQTTISKKLNANVRILPDWTPGPFGSSYDAFRIFRASDIVPVSVGATRLPIPAEMQGKQALVVMLSGAGGGQAGYDGEDGVAPSGINNYYDMAPGPGGPGGQPGQPGERGRMYSFYEAALPAYYTNASIGTGGPGGAENGDLGSPGTDTTLGTHSTANGIQLIDDYINMLTGDAYATLNVAGEPGEAGGIGAGRGDSYPGLSTDGGDHVCEDGTVNQGGAADDGKSFSYRRGDTRYYRYMGGTGGGGAAHGSDGSDGVAGYDQDHETSVGGDGADALPWPKAEETRPGRGGNGGGGGGGAAQCQLRNSANTGFSYGFNYGGKAGKGSKGSDGGDGLIIIFYQTAA